MNATEAKKLIKAESQRLGLAYGKISAKTLYFDGSPAACVTLMDATPHPDYDTLTKFARSNKIVLSVYVNGISG
jgi:hypothetical protein